MLYMTYDEAEAFVKSKDIKSVKEYYKYAKSPRAPANLPSTPNVIYKNKGWIDWKHFLGSSYKNAKKKIFLPFHEAKTLVESIGITSSKQYIIYVQSGNKPINLPSHPAVTYRNKGWNGWQDFLGNSYKNTKVKDFLPWIEAKRKVRSLRIKSSTEYYSYVKKQKKPFPLPSNPNITYQNKGWLGWKDFLGSSYKNSKKKNFASFDEAQHKARSLGIKSSTEYRHYLKCNKNLTNLPSNPEVIYKDKGWMGWRKFLGSK